MQRNKRFCPTSESLISTDEIISHIRLGIAKYFLRSLHNTSRLPKISWIDLMVSQCRKILNSNHHSCSSIFLHLRKGINVTLRVMYCITGIIYLCEKSNERFIAYVENCREILALAFRWWRLQKRSNFCTWINGPINSEYSWNSEKGIQLSLAWSIFATYITSLHLSSSVNSRLCYWIFY